MSSNTSANKENVFSKTLTDVQKNIFVERWSLTANQLDLPFNWTIRKHRLYGGLSEGVDVIIVDNGKLSFTIVPTRGMGIWRGFYESMFLGWKSPVKSIVNPFFLNLESHGGLGWLKGFNEWIVRCGLSSFGAPGPDTITDNQGNKKDVLLTLHGKIANIPASSVNVKIELKPPFRIEVDGTVYEQSMFGPNLRLSTKITTTPDSNTVRIEDITQNLRSFPDEIQLLYHCNYGSPFLEEGSYFRIPVRRVASRDINAAREFDSFDIFGPPQEGYVEKVYFFEPLSDDTGKTKALLVKKDESKAISVSFSLKELPYFTLWKNTSAKNDGYVVGLEPGTSFPNPKSFEREKKRVIRLSAGEKYSSGIQLSAYTEKDEIEKLKEEINRIQRKTKPQYHRNPVSDFSIS